MTGTNKILVCLIAALFLCNPVLAGSCTKCGTGGGNITATIDVNWTFTGAPGTAALVTNIGNSTVAKLDFTIPAGINGTNGIDGAPGATGPTGPMNQTANMTAGPPGPAGPSAYVYGSPGEVLYNIGGNATTSGCMKFNNLTGGFYACSLSGDGGNLTNITAASAISAEHLLFHVKEGGGSALKKGMAVYISGGTVGLPYVRNASNTNSATSRVVGLVYDDININAAGYVVRYGTLDNVDTRPTNLAINPNRETWAAGDLLFLANSVGGGLTNVRPTSGRSVKAAYALSPSSAAGSLLAYPMENPVWITAASGEGIVLRLGDNAAATNISIRNYANTQVGYINSDGTSSFATTSYVDAVNTSMRNNVSQTLNGYQTIANDSATDKGYTIMNQFLTGTWANSTTYYWGTIPAAVTSTAGQRKTYIQKAGTIRAADIYIYSGTAGSNTAWPIYIIKNGGASLSYAIGTVSAATQERHWSNTSLNVPVAAGDYIEIRTDIGLVPVKPATSIGGGYIYIE
jgi:hypothetical protein